MICPSGHRVDREDARFCPKCGKPLGPPATLVATASDESSSQAPSDKSPRTLPIAGTATQNIARSQEGPTGGSRLHAVRKRPVAVCLVLIAATIAGTITFLLSSRSSARSSIAKSATLVCSRDILLANPPPEGRLTQVDSSITGSTLTVRARFQANIPLPEGLATQRDDGDLRLTLEVLVYDAGTRSPAYDLLVTAAAGRYSVSPKVEVSEGVLGRSLDPSGFSVHFQAELMTISADLTEMTRLTHDISVAIIARSERLLDSSSQTNSSDAGSDTCPELLKSLPVIS